MSIRGEFNISEINKLSREKTVYKRVFILLYFKKC